MITLQGKGVSVGIAVGKVLFIDHNAAQIERKTITDVGGELQRFNAAKTTAGEQLGALASSMKEKLGEEHAMLFEVHQMMLEDGDFVDPIVKIINDEKVCAEYAVETGSAKLAQEFVELNDEYMSARAADVRDVAKRVIGILTGADQDLSGNEPVILAADDFTPSETAQFDRSRVLALVSQGGSKNSHTAIFARTMGIPAIIGLGASLSKGISGKGVAIDGKTGAFHIDPTPEIQEEFLQRQRELIAQKELLEKYRGKKTVTKDGRTVHLYTNIGSVADVDAALANDAEGVGLFRSEFLYLGRKDYPDENVQYESYKIAVEKMAGKQVIIRTLDIGADKQADYFQLPHEENPALGMRAIRICLTRPQLFKTQLRALYRASAHGNLAIMFPMISNVSDLVRAKQIAAEVRDELKAQNFDFNEKTPIGIMIETPASVIISDRLAEHCEFFSIGTNDLTQYTLAVDRQNESIAEFCDTHHPAILRMIQLTVDNAHAAGIWCGICGSLGADPELTQNFVEMGVDELSVEPSRILPLRSRICEI